MARANPVSKWGTRATLARKTHVIIMCMSIVIAETLQPKHFVINHTCSFSGMHVHVRCDVRGCKRGFNETQ